MTLPRGLAFVGEGDAIHVVRTTEAPDGFFDEPALPSVAEHGDRAELFRAICDLLEAGPTKSAPIRIAALRRVAGHDSSPLREKADEIGCSHTALAEAVKAMKAELKLYKF